MLSILLFSLIFFSYIFSGTKQKTSVKKGNLPVLVEWRSSWLGESRSGNRPWRIGKPNSVALRKLFIIYLLGFFFASGFCNKLNWLAERFLGAESDERMKGNRESETWVYGGLGFGFWRIYFIILFKRK